MTISSILFLLLITNCEELERLDLEFEQIESESDVEKFMNSYAHSHCMEAQFYILALNARKAKREFWPHQKYFTYKTNYDKISKLIERNPEKIRLRYIRLLISEKAPSFLRNHHHIKTDKEKIDSIISQTNFPEYFKQIIHKNTSL